MSENNDNRGADHPLRRTYEGRMLAGVGSGIADYLDMDVSLVRLGFAALTILGGAGIPLYAAAWLFIPEEGSGESIASHLLQHQRIA